MNTPRLTRVKSLAPDKRFDTLVIPSGEPNKMTNRESPLSSGPIGVVLSGLTSLITINPY